MSTLQGCDAVADWKLMIQQACIHAHCKNWTAALDVLENAAEQVDSSRLAKQEQQRIQMLIRINALLVQAAARHRDPDDAVCAELKTLAQRAPIGTHNAVLWLNIAQCMVKAGNCAIALVLLLQMREQLHQQAARYPSLLGYVCVHIVRLSLFAAQQPSSSEEVLLTLQTCVLSLQQKQKRDLFQLCATVLSSYGLLLQWKMLIRSDAAQAADRLSRFRELYHRELSARQGLVLRIDDVSEEQLLMLPFLGTVSGIQGKAVDLHISTTHLLALCKVCAQQDLPADSPVLLTARAVQLAHQRKHTTSLLHFSRVLRSTVSASPSSPKQLVVVLYHMALASLCSGQALHACAFLQIVMSRFAEQQTNPLTLLRLGEACVLHYQQTSHPSPALGVQLVKDGAAWKIISKRRDWQDPPQDALRSLMRQVGGEHLIADCTSLGDGMDCSLHKAAVALSRCCAILLSTQRLSSSKIKTLAAALTNMVFVALELQNSSQALAYARTLQRTVRPLSAVQTNVLARALSANGLHTEAKQVLSSCTDAGSAAVMVDGCPAGLTCRAALEANQMSATVCSGQWSRTDVAFFMSKHPAMTVSTQWLIHTASVLR